MLVRGQSMNKPAAHIDIAALSEDQLLKTRICDLPLKIEGTWLEDCVNQLYRELEEKGILFRPSCYLADEWLTPDKEPIVGIPFFLADYALTRLEKKMMLEAEGSDKEWCMRLLRHETGHAINYAYGFYKRKSWHETFGSFNEDYEATYRFRPYSKNFVHHLENHYAQYHPDEDFAETFAVWLTPGFDWRKAYEGWAALEKLDYVDSLMVKTKGAAPRVKRGDKYWQFDKMRVTLGGFYRKKHKDYADQFPDFHDNNLKRIFHFNADGDDEVPALSLFRSYRSDIVKSVAFWSGERRFIVDELFKKLRARCRELKLTYRKDDSRVLSALCVYVTTVVVNYVHTGRFSAAKKR